MLPNTWILSSVTFSLRVFDGFKYVDCPSIFLGRILSRRNWFDDGYKYLLSYWFDCKYLTSNFFLVLEFVVFSTQHVLPSKARFDTLLSLFCYQSFLTRVNMVNHVICMFVPTKCMRKCLWCWCAWLLVCLLYNFKILHKCL